MNIYNFLKRRFYENIEYPRYEKELIKSKGIGSKKIVIGSAAKFQTGWIPTDMSYLNILEERDWDKLFNKNSIDAIMAEHVWEHLNYEDGKRGLQFCYEFLKHKGHVRIAVPDSLSPDEKYINWVKPGGVGPGATDHKMFYNYKTLSNLLTECKFRPVLREYYNEEGSFIYNKWEKADGYITRSLLHDKRNKGGAIGYTSLIVDGYKD
jgi:predicted SAM-dependent methyltransferase